MSDLKILIAEDETIIALDIKSSLMKIGYKVIGMVTHGEAAIEAANSLKPDLVLMDIRLNGNISGIEAAQEIYRKFNIPIIFLTGLSDSDTIEKAKLSEAFGYIVKPFDTRILRTSVEMVLYKHQTESELIKKSKELEEEKSINDKLLLNILPDEIVSELKDNGFAVPKHYDNITIMFADLEETTESSDKLSPKEIINELNDLYCTFDDIIENSGLEKLKTYGDTYMVAGGLPIESDDHACKMINVALEMLSHLQKHNENSKLKWNMRIGINTGQGVAGVVGTHKFTYDVWGDTVNIASRLVSSCDISKVNISGSTFNAIKDSYKCTYRGKLSAKGKGEIDMYYVEDKI